MKKKLISLCLALVMVLSLLPVSVYADWTEVDFETYDELLALLEQVTPNDGSVIDWAFYYRGSDPLVIETDLILPAGVALYGYFTSFLVPEGVTLTAYGHIDTDELTINGTLINHTHILVREKLTVNGTLNAHSTVELWDSETILVNPGNITYEDAGVLMKSYSFTEDPDGLQAALEQAAADENPNVYYAVSFHGMSSVFDQDLYIPKNTYVQFNFHDMPNPEGKSLVIASGCTMTIEGAIGLYSPLIVEGILENNGREFLIGHNSGGSMTIGETGNYSGSSGISISYEGDTAIEDVVPGLDLSQFVFDGTDDGWCFLYPDDGSGPSGPSYDFFFSSFQELKEKLALENPVDYIEACYTGTGPLVIEEDFTLYDVYFGTSSGAPLDMIIPEGVTLTNLYSKNGFGTLTVNGTLVNNITIWIYDELKINGRIENNANICLQNGCDWIGSGSIEYGKYGLIERNYYVYEDLTELQDVLQIAAADTDPYVYYGIQLDGEEVILAGNFYVPENAGLNLPYYETTTIPQGSSLILDGFASIHGPLIVEGTLINNNGCSIMRWHDSSLHITGTGSYEGNGEINIYDLNQSKLEDVITGLNLSGFDIEYWYGGEEHVDCYLTPKSDTASGDANGDGTVDNVDAMMVLQVAVGLVDGSQIAYDACDVNGDGAVDNVDAMMILQFTVGLITEFPDAKA